MAVAEEALLDAPVGRIARLSRPRVRVLAFVAAALVGAALVAAGAAAFHSSLAGRILSGVSAAGIDLGGMTPDQARAVLLARLQPLGEGTVIVRSGLGSTTVSFAAIHRAVDVDAVVVAAAAVGRGGTWLDETVAAVRVRQQPVAIPFRIGYDADQARAMIVASAEKMSMRGLDASVVRTRIGFYVIPSLDGGRIDVPTALAAIDKAMHDPATPSAFVVDAPVIPVSPLLTTDVVTDRVATAERMVGDVTVSGGGKTATIPAARVRSWISIGWIADDFVVRVDRAAIAKDLRSIRKKVARPVQNAVFLRDKRGRIVGAEADRAGRVLDVAATVDRIAASLAARAGGATPGPKVALAIDPVAPTVTTADVTKTAPLMVRIGAWTTFYPVGAHNGFGANITIPARTLNGTVVQPGEMFDFWQSLGEVSLRTGYRLGGAIINGHSVEGKALAGGICAASTTLFNAALRGGYEIDARAPHWYYLTRYPLGLDATVSGGSQTMRFRNDTAYPLLIRGFASPGVVRFEIWSIPTGRTVTLSQPIVANVVAGSDSVVRTMSLPAGTQMRTEWPDDGKDVWVTRTVRDANGQVIHRETYFSHYHRMVGILMVGIA